MCTHAMIGAAAWWMWVLMVLATLAFWLMVALVVQLLLGRPTTPHEQGRGPQRSGRLQSPQDQRPARGVHLGDELHDQAVAWRGPGSPGRWP